MAYPRSYNRRRGTARKYTNYRRTRTTNTYRKKWSKASRGMGTAGKRFFKLRTIRVVTSNTDGIIGLTGNDVYTDNITGYEEYSNIINLFDNFKFCAIKLSFIPTAPNDESTTRTYAPFYIVGDPDDASQLQSPAQAIQYENMKVKNLFRPWTYYYKFPTATAFGNTLTASKGYRRSEDISNPNGNNFRAVKTYANNINPNSEWGTMIVTAYICCKYRR